MGIAKAATVSLLAVGALTLAAPGAFAAGTSGTVNNCYTQWWNTAWAQKCDAPGASVSGWYYSKVTCSYPEIPNRELSVNRSKDSTDVVKGKDCAYGITGGTISR